VGTKVYISAQTLFDTLGIPVSLWGFDIGYTVNQGAIQSATLPFEFLEAPDPLVDYAVSAIVTAPVTGTYTFGMVGMSNGAPLHDSLAGHVTITVLN
jgi:hypothetical protein